MPASSDWLLAIDTSTEVAGIALFNGESISELTWRAGRNQTVTVLEQIRHLLRINELELSTVGAVAVAAGPGTFNGLRVGLSTAKGLSYANGIPILGVDTLEATAYPHRHSGHPIRAFVPAGRGRIVYCDYRERNGRWVRTRSPENALFDDLGAGLVDETLLAGETPAGQTLDSLPDEKLKIPPAALRARRPSYVAEIAYRRWQASDVDDIAALEPMYVHGNRASG